MIPQWTAAQIRRRRHSLLLGVRVSADTSTLTSSASSFVAGGAGVTLTFTARDADSNLIAGYTPRVEAGVV